VQWLYFIRAVCLCSPKVVCRVTTNLGKYLYMVMKWFFLLVTPGAIALIQLQEDMKKQLSAEGNYTEVADIEATLSRVCQMVVFLLLLFLIVG